MTAFSAALDLMFEDLNMAEDALWRAGGAGAGVRVRIALAAPDEEVRWRETRLLSQAVIIEVRVSQVPWLAKGDTVEAAGTIYEVMGDPRRDDLGLAWRAEARAL